MGTITDSCKIPACSVQELQTRFRAIQDDKSREQGNGAYAGHIGIADGLIISDKKFKDERDARALIFNTVEKWGPALAVRVGDFDRSFPTSAADRKLMNAYSAISKELTEFPAFLLDRTKRAKSKFRGCKKCDSKIAVGYLTQTRCPVCNDAQFISTPTDEKRIAALRLKCETLRKASQLAESTYNVDTDPKPYWLVGAACAS